MTRTRYWWPTATTEQKLHQVKHAIEARLTKGETAILLGAYEWVISGFASRKGLSFANSDKTHAMRRARKADKNTDAMRIAQWRNSGLDNESMVSYLEHHRRTNDDDVQELRFTE